MLNYKESTRSLVYMMDFFVNDMLDCAVLNSKDKNFVKSFSCFDIRVAIQQIVEMMKEKIEMMNIRMKC